MPARLGRYEIVRELGKGAMGVVYEGRDPNIGRRVAIKTARREVVAASGMATEMMERFLREARAAGALTHPNIITIYDADEEDGITYIAMEYIQGGNLADVIRNRAALDFEKIVDYGATIALALAAAHDAGIIHRDIKPANILTPTGGPLKLADFGIAHVSDSNLTQDGAMIGTPHYMSPEQFMGQKVDGRSDLFSVGIILYELVTGEKPFGGEGLSAVMHNVTRVPPVPPKDLNFAVPDPLNDVILKALAKRPAERYADGRAFAAALRESLKPQPDVGILQLNPTDNDATVNLHPTPNDTVLTPADASTRSDTTVQRAPQAPAPPTTFGGPPPGADTTLSARPDSTVSVTATLSKRSPLPLILSGAGFLVLLVGVLFMTMRGRPEAAAPVDSGVAASHPAPPEVPADSGAPYYSSVRFDLYQAKDMETFLKWNNMGDAQQNTDDIIDGLKDVQHCKVSILDGKDRTKVLIEKQIDGMTGKLSWEGTPESVILRAVLPDGKDAELALTNPPPTKPGDSAGTKILVFPPSE